MTFPIQPNNCERMAFIAISYAKDGTILYLTNGEATMPTVIL